MKCKYDGETVTIVDSVLFMEVIPEAFCACKNEYPSGAEHISLRLNGILWKLRSNIQLHAGGYTENRNAWISLIKDMLHEV